MKKFTGIALFLFLAIPPVAKLLESYMVTHMLVQIPALIVAGYLMGKELKPYWPKKLEGFNNGGIAGILLFTFVITYWSLPRALDAAINYPTFETLKFITNTFFAGVPLALSWHKFHPIGKGFYWANIVSMIFVMSWLYIAAPVRLCNNYLVSQQLIVGKVFFVLGVLLSLVFIVKVMIGFPQKDNIRES